MAAPALAQDAANNAPASQGPKLTDEKAFSDWAVRCFAVKSQTPCEMTSFRVIKKTGQRILGVQLIYLPGRDAQAVIISVPLGVNFANGLVFEADTYKSPVIKFRYCNQMGCYVQALLPNDVIANLKRATKAQINVVNVDGRRLQLPMSLKGFNDADSALVELTKAKASGGSAAPAESATP